MYDRHSNVLPWSIHTRFTCDNPDYTLHNDSSPFPHNETIGSQNSGCNEPLSGHWRSEPSNPLSKCQPTLSASSLPRHRPNHSLSDMSIHPSPTHSSLQETGEGGWSEFVSSRLMPEYPVTPLTPSKATLSARPDQAAYPSSLYPSHNLTPPDSSHGDNSTSIAHEPVTYPIPWSQLCQQRQHRPPTTMRDLILAIRDPTIGMDRFGPMDVEFINRHRTEDLSLATDSDLFPTLHEHIMRRGEIQSALATSIRTARPPEWDGDSLPSRLTAFRERIGPSDLQQVAQLYHAASNPQTEIDAVVQAARVLDEQMRDLCGQEV